MTLKVLVFPCGSQPAIDLNFALRHAVRVELFGASSVDDHGRFVYENYIGGLPNIAEAHFIDSFNRVLREHAIDYVIPTHDTVALFLVEHQERLSARVIASDLDTVRVCRSKALTYERFADCSFVPQVYPSPEAVDAYPVFLKPDEGQGGKGTALARSERELRFHLEQDPDLLICEHLPQEEISVDCFTDRHGRLRLVSPRTRGRTLAGISVHSEWFEPTAELTEIAETIHARLKFRGYWFFQLKKDKLGSWKLLEVCSRMAGTSCLTVGRDIHLPLLSILDFAGFDIAIQPNEYEIAVDRALVNRYRLGIEYENVYVDLDDTLLVRGQVNTMLMMFLYQCVNRNKRIFLITKHEHDVRETLHAHKLSPALFTEILHLKSTDHKYERMSNDPPALFIDNSFAERKEVRDRLGLPSFDVNNVECLLDWRG